MRELIGFIISGGEPDKVKVEVSRKRWADAFLIATAVWFVPTAIWGIAKIRIWMSSVEPTNGYSLWTDWIVPLIQVLLFVAGLGFYFLEKLRTEIVEIPDPNHPPYDPRNLY